MTILQDVLDHTSVFVRLMSEAQRRGDKLQSDQLAVILNVAENIKDREQKSYVVSDSLLSALLEVDCDEVGPYHVSGSQSQHFILKKGQIFDGSEFYNEMFVIITPPKTQNHFSKNSLSEEYTLTIALVGPENAENATPMYYTGARFRKGSTIEEVIS